MAFLLISFALCLTAVVSQNSAQIADLMAAHRTCMSRTGISPALAAGVVSGRFPNDPVLKEHLLCIHQILGVQDPTTGAIRIDQVERIAAILDPNANRANLQQVVARCAIQKSTPQDTAIDMDRCFYMERDSAMG